MYYVYADDNSIYNPLDKSLTIHSPKINLELGKAGSFQFDMPPTNLYYNSLTQLKTIIKVEIDNTTVFYGRVFSITRSFNNMKKVYCEGILSYLIDTVQKGKSYKGKARALFSDIITAHNNMVGSDKQFQIGTVNIEDVDVVIPGKKDNEGNYYGDAYEQAIIDSIADEWLTSYDYIENILIDYLGGFLIASHQNGRNRIDYISEQSYEKDLEEAKRKDLTVPEIDYGVNMLDLQEEINAEELFTVIVPIGDDNLTIEKATNKDSHDDVRIETVDGKQIGIADKDAVEIYGKIVKSHVFDNVNEANTLFENGYKYLKLHKNIPISFTVKAVDMHFVNKDERIMSLGDVAKINSAPHNLIQYLICTKIEYDLNDPSKNTYTFGNPKESLTERYKKNKQKDNKRSSTSSKKSGTKALSTAGDIIKTYTDDVLEKVNDNYATTRHWVEDHYAGIEDAVHFVSNNGEGLVASKMWVDEHSANAEEVIDWHGKYAVSSVATTKWANDNSAGVREAINWYNSKALGVIETKKWIDAYGANIREAAVWNSKYAFSSVYTTKWANDNSAGVREAINWYNTKAYSVIETQKWVDAYGANIREAAVWNSKYAVSSVETTKWAKDNSAGVREAISWYNKHAYSVIETKKWIDAYGANIREAAVWNSKYAFSSVYTTKWANDNSAGVREAISWYNTKAYSVIETQKWVDAYGANIREAAVWNSKYAVSSVETTKWAKDNSAGVREAISWYNKHAYSVIETKKWIDAYGANIREAAVWNSKYAFSSVYTIKWANDNSAGVREAINWYNKYAYSVIETQKWANAYGVNIREAAVWNSRYAVSSVETTKWAKDNGAGVKEVLSWYSANAKATITNVNRVDKYWASIKQVANWYSEKSKATVEATTWVSDNKASFKQLVKWKDKTVENIAELKLTAGKAFSAAELIAQFDKDNKASIKLSANAKKAVITAIADEIDASNSKILAKILTADHIYAKAFGTDASHISISDKGFYTIGEASVVVGSKGIVSAPLIMSNKYIKGSTNKNAGEAYQLLSKSEIEKLIDNKIINTVTESYIKNLITTYINRRINNHYHYANGAKTGGGISTSTT